MCSNAGSGGGGANKPNIQISERRVQTLYNPFTKETYSSQVMDYDERLTSAGFMKTVERLNPNTISITDEITINGVKYKKDKALTSKEGSSRNTTVTKYVYQSTTPTAVERNINGTIREVGEFPFVTIAVSTTTRKTKSGTVEMSKLERKKTRIGLI